MNAEPYTAPFAPARAHGSHLLAANDPRADLSPPLAPVAPCPPPISTTLAN
jgi:hypothetical protein